MIIPAPTPLGRTPAVALCAPFGWVAPEQLEMAKAAGRAPVILHCLGDEKARRDRGPREFREETAAALEKADWNNPWGLGAICSAPEDAAHFATAGFTWFKLELSALVDARANTMSLDELDAAIVALEDAGAYRAAWHERYLGGQAGTAVELSDEALARCAVRFGPVLAEAEQIVQALRVSSSDRGSLPDLEISIARGASATTPQDLAFLAAEILHRGLIHNAMTRIAPALGSAHEPGLVGAQETPTFISDLLAVCPPGIRLSLPQEIAEPAGLAQVDWNAAPEGVFAWLKRMAKDEPRRFREWLKNAQERFPFSRVGWNFTTAEDDVRFLPEVGDDALVSTFLETTQGRQLLLASWEELSGRG